MIERNPFMSDIILSIGKRIFAIWSETNQSTPILWRRRNANITCAQWSPTRMSLIFLACYGGNIELWNLIERTDQPCISYKTAATIITIISQHKLALPTDILLIGDQKSNLRAFTLPSTISQSKADDLNVSIIIFQINLLSECETTQIISLIEQKFKDFIETELHRKQKFNEWQQLYAAKNEDLEEAKQLIREESRKTFESSMPQPVEMDFKIKDQKRHSSTTTRPK